MLNLPHQTWLCLRGTVSGVHLVILSLYINTDFKGIYL